MSERAVRLDTPYSLVNAYIEHHKRELDPFARRQLGNLDASSEWEPTPTLQVRGVSGIDKGKEAEVTERSGVLHMKGHGEFTSYLICVCFEYRCVQGVQLSPEEGRRQFKQKPIFLLLVKQNQEVP